jgi:photosystem II stability/assembly factor-like uncharacterized protein
MRGRLIVALVALLVIADVVLITLAVRRGHPGAVAGGLNTTKTSNGPAQTAGQSAGRAFVSGADTVVLRAAGGSCKSGDPPVLELSTDSGVTFAPTAQGLGVAQVLRVVVNSASELWFVGTDDQCTPSIWRSHDAGSGWSQTLGTGGAWHLLPAAGASKVHAPTGQKSPGCSVASLSPVDGQTARILCASDAVLGTTDGGSTWVILGRLHQAQLIAYDSAASGVALGSTPACDVQAFVTADGGTIWTRTDCLQGTQADALAYQDGSVIALVDAAVLISGDGGQTWYAP